MGPQQDSTPPHTPTLIPPPLAAPRVSSLWKGEVSVLLWSENYIPVVSQSDLPDGSIGVETYSKN